jgi:hypothetical protein
MKYYKNDRRKYESILVISDQHIPYQHPDMMRFLAACKKKYEPDYVVNIGDEVDAHALSFHDSDPDLPSAGDELRLARKHLKTMYKMFPEMTLVESNHGSMVYRKGKHFGIPTDYLKSYRDILHAPEGWVWVDELILQTATGPVMFRHQFKKDPLIFAQQMAMHVCQGHYHEDFNVQYVSTPHALLWAATAGCLIDKKSLAFAYNKANTKRPILGIIWIFRGLPYTIPMLLSEDGRWIGKL